MTLGRDAEAGMPSRSTQINPIHGRALRADRSTITASQSDVYRRLRLWTCGSDQVTGGHDDGRVRRSRSKTKASILDGGRRAHRRPNLQGGDIVLEAVRRRTAIRASIGTATDPIANVASIGTGTTTARAQGSVNLAEHRPIRRCRQPNPGQPEPGDGVSRRPATPILSAQGSILAALDNGFTTIQAHNITLTATNGTIGNIVNGAINYVYLDATSGR